MAVGDVRYIDTAAIEAECNDFADVLKDHPDIFVEPFMNAPSPGVVAAAIKNQHYGTDLEYLQALGDALRIKSRMRLASACRKDLGALRFDPIVPHCLRGLFFKVG